MNVQAQKEEESVVRSWKQPSAGVVLTNGGREEKVEAEACVHDGTA